MRLRGTTMVTMSIVLGAMFISSAVSKQMQDTEWLIQNVIEIDGQSNGTVDPMQRDEIVTSNVIFVEDLPASDVFGRYRADVQNADGKQNEVQRRLIRKVDVETSTNITISNFTIGCKPINGSHDGTGCTLASQTDSPNGKGTYSAQSYIRVHRAGGPEYNTNQTSVLVTDSLPVQNSTSMTFYSTGGSDDDTTFRIMLGSEEISADEAEDGTKATKVITMYAPIALTAQLIGEQKGTYNGFFNYNLTAAMMKAEQPLQLKAFTRFSLSSSVKQTDADATSFDLWVTMDVAFECFSKHQYGMLCDKHCVGNATKPTCTTCSSDGDSECCAPAKDGAVYAGDHCTALYPYATGCPDETTCENENGSLLIAVIVLAIVLLLVLICLILLLVMICMSRRKKDQIEPAVNESSTKSVTNVTYISPPAQPTPTLIEVRHASAESSPHSSKKSSSSHTSSEGPFKKVNKRGDGSPTPGAQSPEFILAHTHMSPYDTDRPLPASPNDGSLGSIPRNDRKVEFSTPNRSSNDLPPPPGDTVNVDSSPTSIPIYRPGPPPPLRSNPAYIDDSGSSRPSTPNGDTATMEGQARPKVDSSRPSVVYQQPPLGEGTRTPPPYNSAHQRKPISYV